jgi:ATP-binding cassette subfamily B (MDR/TAP) protein 1
VQQALDEASKSRTTVCIAHRLSTIKNADKIVVISRGEIVEEGTHTDLIALGGIYKGLVEAQKISAERKEGIEKAIAQGEAEEEFIDKLVKLKSVDTADQLQLSKTRTGRSVTSTEAEKLEFASAGIVPQTQYSNIQLIKKVLPLRNEELMGRD